MRRALIALALGTSLMLAAVIATAAQADQQAVPFFRSETTGSLVSVTWEPQANMLNRSLAETASYLVSLPPGTESFSVTLDSGAATALTDGKVLRMRGHLHLRARLPVHAHAHVPVHTLAYAYGHVHACLFACMHVRRYAHMHV